MIEDVDESLRQLIDSELHSAFGSVAVTFGPVPPHSEGKPPSKSHSSPTVSLFLHDIRENLARRDQSFSLKRPPGGDMATRKRAPVILDLTYMVAVYGDSTVSEHRLISELLGLFLRNNAIPSELLFGELQGQGANSVTLSVAQPDHVQLPNAIQLWTSLDQPLRPTISLTVSAPFDPFEPTPTRVVREALLGLGQGTGPDGARRPLQLGGTRVCVAGVVTAASDGEPLAKASVTIESLGRTARSDERGLFYLLDLPAGDYTVVVRKPGYIEQLFESTAPPVGRPDLLKPLTVRLEEMPDAALALHATGDVPPGDTAWGRPAESRISVSGTIRYSTGRPASYVAVRLAGERITADKQGVYCFYNLPAATKGASVTVEVPGSGDVEVESGNATVPLVKRPSGGMDGASGDHAAPTRRRDRTAALAGSAQGGRV